VRSQITIDLCKAGIISFAVGVILFFVQGYLSGGLLYLSWSLAPEDQVANAIVSGASLTVWAGAFVLILAGAVMFFVGRGKLKASASEAE
jgi:hypothetical protein